MQYNRELRKKTKQKQLNTTTIAIEVGPFFVSHIE